MEEADFQRLLTKYPIVRSRDSVLRPSASRKRPAAGAAAGDAALLLDGRLSSGAGASSASSSASASAAAANVRVPHKDFWQGLGAFLELHYGPAKGKAVAAKFDELHYSSLRGLSYEDVDDLAQLFLRETNANATSSSAPGGGTAAAGAIPG